MDKKNSIKIISLYTLFENNEMLIFSILYHIFILIFNYYSSNQLICLQNTFKDFEKCFNLIQYNIQICQTITFFTLFFLIYFSDKILIKNIKKDNRQILIMSFSYVSKMTIFIYQNSIFSELNLCFNNNSKPNFGPFYDIIEISYLIRIVVFLVLLSLFIAIPIIITCDVSCKKIIKWSKTYKIKFIEKNINNGSEDV